MFRPALGVAARTLLRRFCGQATAAGSLSRPAGASRLRHLHVRTPSGIIRSPSAGVCWMKFLFMKLQSQQAKNVGDAATATAGHRFGLFRRYLKPHAMAIAGLSTAGAGLWYVNKNLPQSPIGLWYSLHPKISDVLYKIMNKDLPPSEIEWDVPSGAGVSEADWVEACVVSSADWVAEVDWVEAGAVSPFVRNQSYCGECLGHTYSVLQASVCFILFYH